MILALLILPVWMLSPPRTKRSEMVAISVLIAGFTTLLFQLGSVDASIFATVAA
jgi:hypothetical protein